MMNNDKKLVELPIATLDRVSGGTGLDDPKAFFASAARIGVVGEDAIYLRAARYSSESARAFAGGDTANGRQNHLVGAALFSEANGKSGKATIGQHLGLPIAPRF